MAAVAIPSTGGGGGETSTHAAYSAADIDRTCPQRWLNAVRRAKMRPTLHITLFLLFVIVSIVIILIVVFASWPEQREEEERRRLNFTRYRFDDTGTYKIKDPVQTSTEANSDGTTTESNETVIPFPSVKHYDHEDSISEESSHHRNVFVQNKAAFLPDFGEFANETSLLNDNDTQTDGTEMINGSTIYDILNNTQLFDLFSPTAKGSVVDVLFPEVSDEFSSRWNFSTDSDTDVLEYPSLSSEDLSSAGTDLRTVHIGQETSKNEPSVVLGFTPVFGTSDSPITEQAHYFVNNTEDLQLGSSFMIQATPSFFKEMENPSIINTVAHDLNSTTTRLNSSTFDNDLSSLFVWYGNMNESSNSSGRILTDISTSEHHDLASSFFNSDFRYLASPVILVLNTSSPEFDSVKSSKDSSDLRSTDPTRQSSWHSNDVMSSYNASFTRMDPTSVLTSSMIEVVTENAPVMNTALMEDRSTVTSLTTDTTSLATSFTQTIQVSDANDYIIRYILKMESTSALSTTYDPNLRTASDKSSQMSMTHTILMPTATMSTSTTPVIQVATTGKDFKSVTLKSALETITTGENIMQEDSSKKNPRKNMVGEVEEASVDTSVQAGTHWLHEETFHGAGSDTDAVPDEVGFFPESFTENPKQLEDVNDLALKSFSTTGLPNGNALDTNDPEESFQKDSIKEKSAKQDEKEGTTTEEPCGSSDADVNSSSEKSGWGNLKEEPMSAECRSRSLPFCDEVATYNATYLPNLAGAISETEKWQLAYYYNSILDWSCNLWLKEYMCYILEPICVENIAVPPCNGLCRVAKKGCEKFISQSASLEAVFQCDSYPQASAQVLCAGLGNGEPCRDTEFRCSDGTCIPATWRCDGVPDCEQADDEKQCLRQSGVVGISTL